MKYLMCAYRDWAVKLYNMISFTDEDCEIMLIESQDYLEKEVDKLVPDIIFFIGWSWILPKEIVEKYYCVCLHPSPLPKYRGGSPIQHQIINGEKTSAVTLFKMTTELDKGPILYQEPLNLTGNLKVIFDDIISAGFNGIRQIIGDINSGHIIETPQDESKATYYKRRTPAMSEITTRDLTIFSAEEIHNKVRALADPYPNAYIMLRGKKLYIRETFYE